jgi:glycosyltransferase involved in cell wall biosynthesis
MSDSILIITIPPLTGGVPDKAKVLSCYLKKIGYDVTVSHYATYRDYPKLVVTLWELLRGKKPSIQQGKCFCDLTCISVGCILPELEFTYYLPTKAWRTIINDHQRHIVVGGTVLTSFFLSYLKLPHLVWCASTMLEDRIDRQRSMSIIRRIFDRFFICPIQHFMEQKILTGNGHLMAVSSYTRNSLISAGGHSEKISSVPIPVNLKIFAPPLKAPKPRVIGFAGRAADPRKNLNLLFSTLKSLIEYNRDFELILTGRMEKPFRVLTKELGIYNKVSWLGWLDEGDLPNFYKKLDVFVIPSTQEGLNIAGLQAMATAVPVVSTYCGGPEDYVIHNKTGSLVSFSAKEMTSAILNITEDREKRNTLGMNARKYVEDNYSHKRFEESFRHAWYKIWGDKP